MFRIFALQDAAAMLANLDTRPQPPRKPQTPVNIYIMQPRAPLVVRIRLAARKRDDPRTVDQCAECPLLRIVAAVRDRAADNQRIDKRLDPVDGGCSVSEGAGSRPPRAMRERSSSAT